jgi:hypothetical protein
MAAKDPDALDCDFAEVYGVLDREALPPKKAAALACGLSPDSRIRRKLNGQRWPMNTLLTAMATDRLGELVWTKTKDGQRGRNRPKSILRILTEDPKKNEPESLAFDTPEEFERARRAIISQS